jgi:hypothetical protein
MVGVEVEGHPMTEERRTVACPRCKGRMLLDAASGDHACFTCGHVRYREVAEPVLPGTALERRPSHGGQSLG